MRRLLLVLLLLLGCAGEELGPVTIATPPPSALLVDLPSFAREVQSGVPLVVLAAESLREVAPVTVFPGARYVNVDDLADFSLRPGAFEDLAGWSQRIGALGLAPESDVVVYDDGTLKFSARIRFLLQRFGVSRVRILLGGAASAAQVNMSQLPGLVPTEYQARIVEGPVKLVFRQQVAAALGQVRLVDVRTPAEFDGQLLLPGDARPGHIPGAVNVDQNLIFANGQFIGLPAVRQLFEAAGVVPGPPIIVYCHDGAKSSLMSALLVELGYPDVSLYYDSYQDWSKDFSLPVEL